MKCSVKCQVLLMCAKIQPENSSGVFKMKRNRLVGTSKREIDRYEGEMLGLDKLDLSCYTWREITIMMTTDASVKRAVLHKVKQILKPGFPVTRTVWKAAYAIVRTNAIKETVEWKRQYITIEETL